MISEKLNNNYKKIAKYFTENKNQYAGVLTKKDIDAILNDNGIKPDTMFLPSDICYNHTTKPLGEGNDDFESSVHVFEYVDRNKYKVLGEGYPYTGLVLRKRKADNKEIIVGEWYNGKLIKWDKNKQCDIDDFDNLTLQMIEGISKEIDALEVNGEEKRALVKIRVNQGIFRDRLLQRYSHCCLCGVNSKSLLIASHIKPWSACEPQEKLDVNNGFLLCPNHDYLFDKGYISFDEKGQIIISNELSDNDRVMMNVRDNMSIDLCIGNINYLKYHWTNVLK